MKKYVIKKAFLFCLIGFNLLGVDSLHFFKEFCLHPKEVGAIAATSSFTGEELCHFISQDKNRPGLKILEVGGGFGNVSEIIVGQMLPQDSLNIIEINQNLCGKIEKRIGQHDNVSIQCCSILDWKPEFEYDLIISTLPFNSFSYIFFLDVFEHIRSLGTKEVLFSYVEYLGFGKVRDIFSFDEDIKNIKLFLKNEQKKHTVRESIVWFNLPPLTVRHLRINE